eukprot:10144694-Lingulodinium_polyedra.AAC.1
MNTLATTQLMKAARGCAASMVGMAYQLACAAAAEAAASLPLHLTDPVSDQIVNMVALPSTLPADTPVQPPSAGVVDTTIPGLDQQEPPKEPADMP